MAYLLVNVFPFLFAAFCSVSLLPLIHSLSTVAISETGNQTLVCALVKPSYDKESYINCTSFPQGNQVALNPPPLTPISGIVGGDGFLCALSSFYSSSSSIMVCWRFSSIGTNMVYKRIYLGPILKELDSGNSQICGLVNGTISLQCWQGQGFNNSSNFFSSSISVGEDFLCGLSDVGEVHCLGSDRNVTDHVPEGRYVVIRAGFRHACAISLNGSMVCWGNMADEKPIGEFTSLALGENRSCGLRPNGTAVCWGENGFNLPPSLRETFFIALEGKREVFCGVENSNYSLVCWGNESFDSSPVVFNDVVPGACRNGDDCRCGNLPNYGRYCGTEGLVICQPCDEELSGRSPPPVGPSSPLPEALPPSPPSQEAGKDGKWNSRMVAFLVVGCFGSLSLLATMCILFFRYCKVKGLRVHDSGRLEEGGPVQQNGQTSGAQPAQAVMEKRLSHLISMGNGGHLEEYSLQVLVKATNNFSEENKIGTGSFGSVYRGTLDDGRELAIKRAEISSSSTYAGTTRRCQEDKESAFLNELEFLSRLNHKNLVKLLGYCEDSEELILVYEHMHNGTLHDHLHKLEDSPLMSWPTRIKVALDAARGIEYLHEYALPQVIHRDIKSSNILLDALWTAKVSDFGLSLMGPKEDESHLSLRAAGTVGYMDPEYYRFQKLTTKSDVYSFGVVLLEMLSGCKAIHKNENGVPRNVVDYVVPYIIQDEIHRVLDKRVPPPTPFEIEAVAYVGYLAADCVMPEGTDRPTMTEVVNSLDRALGACLAPAVLSRSTTGSSILQRSSREIT